MPDPGRRSRTAPRADVDVLSDVGRAAALLDPMRLRLVGALRDRPDSAAGLARRLDLPRQRLGYHLRELERVGLLEEVERRPRGNCIERVLRPSAASYLVGPQAVAPVASDPDRLRDRLGAAYLLALASRLIRELAELMRRSARARKKLSTLALETEVRFADARRQAAFADELTRLVHDLAARYHDEAAPRGRTFRVLALVHQAITRPEEKAHDRTT
jgi:DNA-binding transcriptional ArsR family regulator